MNKALLLPLVMVAAIAISGCTTPYDGSPPKVDQARINSVTASAAAWLASQQGLDNFPAGSVFAGPVAVFDSNRSFEHWVLPVKNNGGMYIGYLITKNDSFTTPELGVGIYPDPRHNLFSKTSNEAYNMMLNSSAFSAGQIREPYLSTVEGKGYHWTSEVVVNGKHVQRLIVPISIIFPSEEDTKTG